MRPNPHQPSSRRHLRRLAACVAAALALEPYAMAQPAAAGEAPPLSSAIGVARRVIVVSTCDDTGPGSLRDAVAHAVDGTLVDLRHLACSAITLKTGAIHVAVANLGLIGPGADRLAIDAHFGSGVLEHVGTGLLRLDDVTLAHGRRTDADGGCVSTAGQLRLDGVVVSDCAVAADRTGEVHGGCIAASGEIHLDHSTVGQCAISGRYSAGQCGLGAGVYAGGDLTLVSSTLSGNGFAVADHALATAAGGGAFVQGDLNAFNSTIADNSAFASLRNQGRGGGVEVVGDALIDDSTISGNTAAYGAGALLRTGTLVNSTVSGNEASFMSGGLVVQAPFELIGSTIAFNTEPQPYGAGVYVRSGVVDAVSTIVANNAPFDVGGNDFAGAAVSGSHDLFMTSSPHVPIPADTLSDDPLLQPLADNGGPTRTHALAVGSPALDAGIDAAGEATDQRGGSFLRRSGRAPDIGAFELQQGSLFSVRTAAH